MPEQIRWTQIEDAFDEFETRCAVGKDIDVGRFCERFPGIEDTLCRYIETSLVMKGNPQTEPGRPTDWPKVGFSHPKRPPLKRP